MTRLASCLSKVIAIEYDEALAAQATRNLAYASNVDVICADGAKHPLVPADCIYVNFGVGRPADAWIDKLMPGGRLVLPLGSPIAHPTLPGRYTAQAIGLLVTRTGQQYAASSLGGGFIRFR